MHAKLFVIFYFFTQILLAQSANAVPVGNGGGILRPVGDKTFSNILVGSAVTPAGQVGYTKDIYLVRPGGFAPKRLTTFDPSNYAPGATGLAISPDGTRGAYLAILNSGGTLRQELHAIDPTTGNDLLLAINNTNCGTVVVCPDCGTPCWGNLAFSQDGVEVIGTGSGGIFVANYDGSGLRQLASGSLSRTPNVTTGDGHVIFTSLAGSQKIGLDGSGLTLISPSIAGVFVSEATISADGSTIGQEFCGGQSTGPNIGCSLSAGGKGYDRSLVSSFSGPAFSSNGSVAAWIDLVDGNQAAGTLKVLDATGVRSLATRAFDAGISADGAKLLYSTGLGQVRGAVWISDISGNNATPLFAPRSINNNGITGLSSGPAVEMLSPGTYFTIYGTNFKTAPDLVTAPSLPLPRTLGGITVLVNGTAVPLQAVTPWQINALLPQNTAIGQANVRLLFQDGFTLAATPAVAPTAPALITYGSFSFAAVFHGATAVPVDPANPAQAGEVVASYGFGLGLTTPLPGKRCSISGLAAASMCCFRRAAWAQPAKRMASI